MKRILKILLWTVMVAVLLVVGSVAVVLKLLTPERLTPLVEAVANRTLNADVDVERVALRLRHSYPFLNLELDSLTIISRDITRLSPSQRDTLPAWGDTLAYVGHLRGGINLARLMQGAIVLNDVEISQPRINVMVVNERLNNFDIYPTAPSDDQESGPVPDIRVKSFRIVDPGPVRYADLSSGTYVEAQISHADLESQAAQEGALPTYHIVFNTNVVSPLLEMIGRDRIDLALDGMVDWRHVRPYELTLSDFDFAVSELSGRINLSADFTDSLVINKLDLRINPIDIAQVLSQVPPEMARELRVPQGLRTTAAPTLSLLLTRPYTLGADLIPYMQARLELPECMLRWGRVDLRRLALQLSIELQGSDLNAAVLDLQQVLIAGPATTISVRGRVTDMLRDPLFDGYARGWINLDRLPPVMTRLLGGLQAKGRVTIDSRIKGRPSMFSRNGFHKLQVDGHVNVSDLYYLAPDTLTMVQADNIGFKFSTSRSLDTRRGRVDSILTATVTVDTTRIMVSGLDIRVKGLSLGVGSLNKRMSDDTTAIIPMGGRLQVENFSLFTMSDSAGVRIRELKGMAGMQRYNGDDHLPLFRLNAELGRISVGNNTTRFVVRNAQLNTSINKLPDDELSRGRRQLRQITDSLRTTMPNLDPDSAYQLALEIRRRNRAGRGPRVHTAVNEADQEVIDWGTSSSMQRLLLDWKLQGTLTAKGARLFTSSFPVRNRVRNLNLHFNNDSIVLENVEYKAGHSDFLVSGSVSNMRQAFGSRRPQPLRINFDLLSDTIDVNELSAAFFTGAANKDAKLNDDVDDESQLDDEPEIQKPDSVGPLLIPVNIDAKLNLNAKHVIYSDLLLDGMQGEALMYDGALNLHQLRAASKVGSIDLSALYSAPNKNDMKFGFGMKLSDFNIRDFLNLMPAIDSIMPMMSDLGGIINADVAATSDIDHEMNLVLPTLDAAINISGDSLVVLDERTFKTMAKWLMFKDKHSNVIPHMSVQVIVENNMLQLYPFVFDFDRYRLGVQGHNDLEMNFDYHVAVLKSPVPFKFGINIKGNVDDYKIRVGRAHFNEKQVASEVALVDTTRVNLIRQFENVFRRGVRNSNFAKIEINERPTAANIDISSDTISAADSLYMRQQGLIP